MSCYHPLKAFKIGVHVSGKDKYKIVPYDVHHITQYTAEGGWVPVREPFYGSVGIHRSEWIEIPCGHCVGCRLDYSRQWANRCMLELQYHKSAYFVTLTYDEEHVPRCYHPDVEVDEMVEEMTLCKRDFQLFMKRLRKFTGQKLRYFACGEYGSQTFRPHYHAIIYGLELDDLEVYSRKNSYVYYNSDTLSRIWSYGHVVVGEVNWDTCAYTARYIMKKVDGEDKIMTDVFKVQPEFTLMSRKPGIAYQYLIDHPEVYDYDQINISTPRGGKQFKPPRYFDKLFDIDNHEKMVDVKERRKADAKASETLKLSRTNLSKLEQLEVEERIKRNKIKSLLRKEI